MPSAKSLRIWSWLHTWTSLICTLFMLLLCLTGLPLIFHHEIGHLLGTEAEPVEMPADTPRINLDRVIEIGEQRNPDLTGVFLSQDIDDDRVWYLSMAPTTASQTGFKQVAVDARSGEVLAEPQLESGFMYIVFSLHVDLFAGLPGMLFLGLMGVFLLISLVSGALLYGPFMRKLEFGEVRRERSKRLKWLDLHNVLGIVTLVWFLVVGATGVINAWGDLLVKLWQNNELSEMLAPYQGQPAPASHGSLHAAVESALRYEPEMEVLFVAFPGSSFSSPYHYAVFMHGDQPLTSRMAKPVLVDSVSAQVTDARELPWYLKALQISQPLHFGDYGGRGLQLLWALLDVITIVVLGSGLYLWVAKRRRPSSKETLGRSPGTEEVQ